MIRPREERRDDDDAWTEVAARLAAMRERERSYVVPDYLADGRRRGGDGRRRWEKDLVAPPSPSTSSVDVGGLCCAGAFGAPPSSRGKIGEAWREKVVRWYYQLVDGYEFDREIVSVAASCLDRHLAVRAVDDRGFRLAGMAALYLAVKLHSHRKLRVSHFVRMSHGAFAAEEIEEAELDMLRTLRWRVNPVTPRAVCRELLRLLPPEEDRGDEDREDDDGVEETALFLTELSVCDYRFATRSPSRVALAAVALAIDLRRPPSSRGGREEVAAFLARAAGAAGGGPGDDVVYGGREVGDCCRVLRSLHRASFGGAGGGRPTGGASDEEATSCDPRVDRRRGCAEGSLRGLDGAMHVPSRASTSRYHRRCHPVSDAAE